MQKMLYFANLRYEYNEIILYDLSLSPNMEQTLRMLDKAFTKFPRVDGLIVYSDRGFQY